MKEPRSLTRSFGALRWKPPGWGTPGPAGSRRSSPAAVAAADTSLPPGHPPFIPSAAAASSSPRGRGSPRRRRRGPRSSSPAPCPPGRAAAQDLSAGSIARPRGGLGERAAGRGGRAGGVRRGRPALRQRRRFPPGRHFVGGGQRHDGAGLGLPAAEGGAP